MDNLIAAILFVVGMSAFVIWYERRMRPDLKQLLKALEDDDA